MYVPRVGSWTALGIVSCFSTVMSRPVSTPSQSRSLFVQWQRTLADFVQGQRTLVVYHSFVSKLVETTDKVDEDPAEEFINNLPESVQKCMSDLNSLHEEVCELEFQFRQEMRELERKVCVEMIK